MDVHIQNFDVSRLCYQRDVTRFNHVKKLRMAGPADVSHAVRVTDVVREGRNK